MPIIRASEYKHSWIKKAVQDMKTNGSIAAPHRRPFDTPSLMPGQKNTDNEERHTAKCPALPPPSSARGCDSYPPPLPLSSSQ